MQGILKTKNIDKTQDIQNYFDERIYKLGHHLERFNDELIEVHATLERNVHRQDYSVVLWSKILSVVLRAQERSRDPFLAMNTCFESFTRQTEKLKTKLRRKPKRMRRRS